MRSSVLLLVPLLACGRGDTDASESTPLASEYVLEGDDIFPEAIAWDPQSRRFFTSSLARGSVVAVAADGAQSVFHPGDGAPGRATLGVEVDVPHRRLWTCAIVAEGALPGSIWVFDVDTGEPLATFELEETFAGASCNDIAFDGDGIAYVTDRENPNIYRIDVHAGAVTLWATDALLGSDAIGLNGIELSPDGSALLTVVYLPSRLVRISTSDPTDVSEVALDGAPFEGGGVLSGADGTAFRGDTLYVAVEDQLLAVDPGQDGWATGTVTAIPTGATGISAVTVADDRVYVANGQAVEFVTNQEPDLPFRIFEIVP